MPKSARTRLTLSVGRMAFLLTLVLAGALTVYLESRLQATREEALRGRVRALASGAACLIDPSAHAIAARDGADSAGREELGQRLRWFQSQNGLEGVYTVVREAGGEFRYPVAGTVPSDNGPVDPRSRKALAATFSSGVTVVDRIRSGRSGVSISAYAPIRTGNRVDAVLVVEYRTTWPPMLNRTNLILLGVVLAVAVLVGWLTSITLGRRLIAPVEAFAVEARRVAGGDLREEAGVNAAEREFASLQESYSAMVRSLRRLVGRLGESAQELETWSGALREMASTTTQGSADAARMTQELADGADHTAHSTATIAGELVRVDQTVRQIAEVASSGGEMARFARNEADRGASVIQAAAEQAGEASQSLRAAAERMTLFDEWSAEVGRTAGFINTVAEQINLLAVNARIEAARAGESGRGFSIVAEKIGALSEETSTFAERIRGINEEIGPRLDGLGSAVIQTAGMVAQVAEVMESTRETFAEIVRRIYAVNDCLARVGRSVADLQAETAGMRTVTEEVASVTEESAAAIEEVGSSMEEQAAMAEELLAAVEKMHGLADRLKREVSQFRL